MLREIYEQPATLAATLEQYIESSNFRADTCGPTLDWLSRVQGKLLVPANPPAALRKAPSPGHATLAITNVDHSTMAREATASFPTMAGRERAIPATKSFTAQLLNLYLLALMSAVARGAIDQSELALRL